MISIESNRPNGNWLRMHRGWGEKPKLRHRTRLGARWHTYRHRHRYQVDADNIWVYPCWFTDDNRKGRKHYHIGHLPRYKKRAGRQPPVRNGTLVMGIFAVTDGFEARVFGTKPATCYPPGRTIPEALESYARAETDNEPSRKVSKPKKR